MGDCTGCIGKTFLLVKLRGGLLQRSLGDGGVGRKERWLLKRSTPVYMLHGWGGGGGMGKGTLKRLRRPYRVS